MIALSCRRQQPGNTEAVNLELNKDSSQIVLTGLDHTLIQSLKEAGNKVQLQSLFSVYRVAAQEELRGLEKPLPGSYTITSDSIVYIPDSAFAPGNTYKAELRLPQFYDKTAVLSGKKLPGTAAATERSFLFR